jgi:alcohol dehydrogenase
MLPFEFHLRTRIVFGPDKIDLLGEIAGQLGARRVLMVSDPGIRQAGHTQRALDALERAGVHAALFDAVHQNPTTTDVEAGLEIARSDQPEAIVGLGGGSSLKGINFLYTTGGRMQDYWGTGKAQRPMLPMIAVPTTAGTGSETQSFALISDAQTHVKMACGDKKASFHTALLDPRLTLTQPATVTALTGIDAMGTPSRRTSPGRGIRPRCCSAARHGDCWPAALHVCSTRPATSKHAATCSWGPAWPEWPSNTRCWVRRMPWPTR